MAESRIIKCGNVLKWIVTGIVIFACGFYLYQIIECSDWFYGFSKTSNQVNHVIQEVEIEIYEERLFLWLVGGTVLIFIMFATVAMLEKIENIQYRLSNNYYKAPTQPNANVPNYQPSNTAGRASLLGTEIQQQDSQTGYWTCRSCGKQNSRRDVSCKDCGSYR